VLELMEEALSDGRPVYYVYSRFEAKEDNLGSGGRGFDAYFEEVERVFGTRVVLQTSVPEYRLYEVLSLEP
jgi:hypothetical protein